MLWNFFIGGGWKWLLIAAIVSFALKISYDVYTDYRDTKEQVVSLTEENTSLTNANQVNTKTIKDMIEQSERNAILRNELEERNRIAEVDIIRLQTLLSEHNLTYLAIQKPGLIERRINDASNRIFDDFECISGGVCSD